MPEFARRLCLVVCILLVFVGLAHLTVRAADVASPPAAVSYSELIQTDHPVAWWRFEEEPPHAVGSDLKPIVSPSRIDGLVELEQTGPRPPRFPALGDRNQAVRFDGSGGSIRIADPGADSLFDFKAGDSITLESWVNPEKLAEGQQAYLVGKGRTQNPEVAPDNQNYALRLSGKNNAAVISFLFRSLPEGGGKQGDWHRWNSDGGFPVGSGWHHVAVTYTFGQGDSIRGYLDGRLIGGTWDYAGKTDRPPVVDDDEVWIGSSMGASPGSTFHGMLDEVAIYRHAITPARMRERFQAVLPKPYVTEVEIPNRAVLVEVMENIPNQNTWDFVIPAPEERYVEPALAFIDVPHKYNRHGIRTDRTNPFMIRASTHVDLPAGGHRLLLRSRNAARLYVDGALVVENPIPMGRTDGHSEVHRVVSKISANIRPLQPGDQETVVEFQSLGRTHRFQLEVLAGGRNRRPEFGETSVSIAAAGSDGFQVVHHAGTAPLTDAGWQALEAERRRELTETNRRRRHEASREYADYWNRRHEFARRHAAGKPAPLVPEVPPEMPVQNAIDRFLGRKLADAKLRPGALTDDWTFLRRITLDAIGTIPTPADIELFFNDAPSKRRSLLVDRLLANAGWADHWMGYWQDVLAENPNVINPTLNNTGPFRWWLYDALRDNKPFDRFVTELILMEGSEIYGGTAGFAIASQNDAPLAAKAQILAQAFLGMNLRCARCHDAPFHDFSQKDLFSLAAMLNRGPQQLPATSSIPAGSGGTRSSLVEVTLKPGDKITPAWPFAGTIGIPLDPEWLENKNDTREQLAAYMTLAQNERFAGVIVNRLWHRYFGRGLVEPVDDWDKGDPVHPDLLAFLSRELVLHDYDLKHVARLIFNSHAYQRLPTADTVLATAGAAPLRRRLSAEQVVDSLFTAAGKQLNTEELNIDVDGSRAQNVSISLGVAERAWQFTSLSNERDRPSLSLPAAQTIINVLEAFGWRASRQDPVTVREQATSVLQPAMLANGVAAKRITQFSEDSAFTELALRDQSVEEFVEQVFRRVLTRKPRADELTMFTSLLREGYAGRRLVGATPGLRPGRLRRDGVSWSNHLKPEANNLKTEFQKVVERGDPPTTLLDADWRERAEDMIWALINSPEFVFVP